MGAERGHLHARLGSWTRRGRGGRRPGARLPLLARGSGGGGGAVPGWAGPWGTFFLPRTLRRAPGTALGLRAGWQDHPSPLGLYSQLQGAPLPTRAPPSLDQHLVSRKGPSPGRERGWGWRGGVWGVGVGEGASPWVYTPSSLGAGPPDSLGELRPSRGRVRARGPPRKGGGGGRAPAELCAGCFVGAGGLGSVPAPGRGRGGSAATSSLPVRCGKSPVRVFLSARLLAHSSAEILPRALRGLGLLLGPAGVPGLEERRAEWLTTL